MPSRPGLSTRYSDVTPVSGKIKLHYDEMAEVYDKRYDENRGKFYYTHITRHIMEGFARGGRLLDLGCGTGLFVQRYLEHGGSGTGLDISRGMIEKASRRCPTSGFVVGTAEILPFQDCSFDAVSSILSFSYFKQPDATLSEIYRVLAPGGSVAVLYSREEYLHPGTSGYLPAQRGDEYKEGLPWCIRGTVRIR